MVTNHKFSIESLPCDVNCFKTELAKLAVNDRFMCLSCHITPLLSFTLRVLSPLAEALEAALALRVLTTRINGCFGNI